MRIWQPMAFGTAGIREWAAHRPAGVGGCRVETLPLSRSRQSAPRCEITTMPAHSDVLVRCRPEGISDHDIEPDIGSYLDNCRFTAGSTVWTRLFNSALFMMGAEGGKQTPDQLLDTP
jgi:hypothetical protein